MNHLTAALAAAALVATAAGGPGTAYADVPGPRCDIGGTAVGSGLCVFGHPSFTSLRVEATATGAPGLAAVRISITELDSTTGAAGDVVLECSATSESITDSTAECTASVPWSGPGVFGCRIEGAVVLDGTCDSTVAPAA